MEREIPAARKSANEPPPFLGSWSRVYFWLLAYLLVLISALYLISRAFTY